MKIQESLQRIGLTEKEAKVYLAIFALREGTVQDIASYAHVNRPNTYSILDNLVAKGLCSVSKTSGTAKYYIENPRNLLDVVQSKKHDLDAQEATAHELVEELEATSEQQKTEDDEPFIRYFSGKRGLVAMRRDMFEESDVTIRMAYSLDNYIGAFDDMDIKEAHAMRVNKNIFAKVLYTSDETTIADDTTRSTKKLGKDVSLPADIAVYNDKVRLSLFDGTSGVIIKNEKIAETLTTIFDLAWQGANTSAKKSEK